MHKSDIVPERLRGVFRCMNWCLWPRRSERRQPPFPRSRKYWTRFVYRWADKWKKWRDERQLAERNGRKKKPIEEQARRGQNRPDNPLQGNDPLTHAPSNEQNTQVNTATEQQDGSGNQSHETTQRPDWAPDWVCAYLDAMKERVVSNNDGLQAAGPRDQEPDFPQSQTNADQPSRAEREAQTSVTGRGGSQAEFARDFGASDTAAFEMEDLHCTLEGVAEAARAAQRQP